MARVRLALGAGEIRSPFSLVTRREREREREGLWSMDYGRKEKKGVNHQTSRTGTLSPYKSLGACFTLRTRLSRRVSWSDWTRRVFSQELVGSVRTSMLTCLKGGGSASVFVFKP